MELPVTLVKTVPREDCKLVILDVNGTRFIYEGDKDRGDDEVVEEAKTVVKEILFDEFRVPIEPREEPSNMGYGETIVRISLGHVSVPLKCIADIGTTAGFELCYIDMPRDHPLALLVRRAVLRVWNETVEEARIWFWDGNHTSDIKWRHGVELTPIRFMFDGLGGKENAEYLLPLKHIERTLRETIGRREAAKALEEAKRMVEEFLEKVEEEPETVDVEFLEKKAKKSYLQYFEEGDKLDFEL